MRRLRVTIIDVVSMGGNHRGVGKLMNANLASLMPQVVAVWCEELGHRVRFVCYTSAGDLDRQMLQETDVLFISAFTRAAQTAYAKARAGKGPSLIECMTYRHSGHSRADPAKYRPEGELERWKEQDPIKVYRERLRQFGIPDATVAAIDADVRRRVDEATELCKAAPPPPLEILTTDVYADGGFAWRN